MIPTDPDVDVVHGPPSALRDTTCRCGLATCVPVAEVSWTILGPFGEEQREGSVVGRECIAAAVAEVRDYNVHGLISVDLPTWDGYQLVADAGLTEQQLMFWHGRGFLRSEPRVRPTSGSLLRFLSDEVAHAALLARLVGPSVCMSASTGDRLLRERPEVATALLEALAPAPVAAVAS